jgi:TetR/AcrR family transcriptional regulator, cholesterol catabolism regulator
LCQEGGTSSSWEEQKPDEIEENPMKDQTDFKGLDRSVRFQKVIDAAAGLFHKKGFKSATLESLARELGLSKAALYHYVSSKEHLLSMVYGQAFEKIFERIHEISAMDVPPDEKLRLILRDHIKNITIKNAVLFCVFFAEENQLPKEDFQKIRAEKRKYSQIIEDIIKDGVAKGIFRPADPRLQANAILGMCNWVYKWYRPNRSTYTPDQVADHFMTLLEAGYLAGRPPVEAASETSSNTGLQKNTPEAKRQICQKIRLLCSDLSKLLEQIE